MNNRTKNQQEEILKSTTLSDSYSTFSSDVTKGLGSKPKYLPSKYFYDELGSSLFEQISALPEYYVTRTETEILEKNSSTIAEIWDQRSNSGKPPIHDISIVELGSGSSAKTRILLRQFLKEKTRQVSYFPIDISHEMLRGTTSRLKKEFPRINIRGVPNDYDSGIDEVNRIAANRKHDDAIAQRKLILFLGSSIGNFETHQSVSFLKTLRAKMNPETDLLIVGFDLQKETKILNAAYNDAKGITAKFNLNLLTRINKELDGNLELNAFSHHAFYDTVNQRIEMHLVSRVDQEVYVGSSGRSFVFTKGESIHTENSHKYSLPQIGELARQSGLQILQNFVDEREWFSLTLFRAV